MTHQSCPVHQLLRTWWVTSTGNHSRKQTVATGIQSSRLCGSEARKWITCACAVCTAYLIAHNATFSQYCLAINAWWLQNLFSSALSVTRPLLTIAAFPDIDLPIYITTRIKRTTRESRRKIYRFGAMTLTVREGKYPVNNNLLWLFV